MSKTQSKAKPSKLKRVGAVLLGLLLAPVVIELMLQAASLFVSSDRVAKDGDCLVLCQGDSHTYGLWLPPDSAYPAQLEALLVGQKVESANVINRGIPGKTTWQVLNELESDLDRWNPKAVCLWGGVNDRTGQRPDGETTTWVNDLRTVRLFRNLAARLAPQTATEQASAPALPDSPTGDERETFDVSASAVKRLKEKERRLDFEGRDGEMQHLFLHGGNPSVEEYTEWIRDDLERAARLAQARGTLPLILTYPVDDYPRLEINRAAELAAKNTGARFIDLRPHFEAASKVHGWGPLLYGRGHPKALGYSIIARVVLAALVDEQLVDVPEPDPLELVHSWTPAEFLIEAWREDGEVVGLEVNYAPGHRVQILFSDATDPEGVEITSGGSVRLLEDVGERTEEIEWRAGLANTEVLRKGLRRTKRYMVTLDNEGRGKIRMHSELDGLPHVFAVACAITPHEGISRVSAVIELR